MRRQIVSTMYNNIILIFHCYAIDHQVAPWQQSFPRCPEKCALWQEHLGGLVKVLPWYWPRQEPLCIFQVSFSQLKIFFLKGKEWRIFTWILELIIGFSCPSPIIACAQTLFSFSFRKSMSHFHTHAQRSLKRK